MTGKRFVRRQWGWYITLLDRRHFKVKLLRFWKGGECSRQKHQHRNELWLFLNGRGALWMGSNVGKEKSSGSYEFVEFNTYHKFCAWIPTTVLEIQYGEKCVEEDIVRV